MNLFKKGVQKLELFIRKQKFFRQCFAQKIHEQKQGFYKTDIFEFIGAQIEELSNGF
jgi:hypothetical protein